MRSRFSVSFCLSSFGSAIDLLQKTFLHYGYSKIVHHQAFGTRSFLKTISPCSLCLHGELISLGSKTSHLPQRPALNPLFVIHTLNNPLHVHAGRMHLVRLNLAGFNQLLDFGDSDLRGGRHHGIEVARGLAINQVSPPIALPRLDQREVGLERMFEHVRAAVELARFFAFGHNGAVACRSEERWNPRSPGANALSECPLWNQLEIDAPSEHHVFQQFVLADVATLMRTDLSRI